MIAAATEALLGHRAARALAGAAVVVAALVLVYVLTQWLWTALDSGREPFALPPPVLNTPDTAAPSLAQWHLFGNALPVADNRALAAPETTLNLVLRGILAGDGPKDGLAIISDGNQNERTYAVGDDVGGATLDSVYADRVLLSRGGVLETLTLARTERDTTGARSTAAGNGVGTRTAPAATIAAGPAAPQSFVNPNISLGGMDWNQLTASTQIDPAALAQQVSIAPVMENGRFVGVRLSPGRDAALFHQLGLQADDIVTAVNGIVLDSPARAQEIASKLAGAKTLAVTIRRNGATQTLNVSLP
jgi:general secretion pathway protein C